MVRLFLTIVLCFGGAASSAFAESRRPQTDLPSANNLHSPNLGMRASQDASVAVDVSGKPLQAPVQIYGKLVAFPGLRLPDRELGQTYHKFDEDSSGDGAWSSLDYCFGYHALAGECGSNKALPDLKTPVAGIDHVGALSPHEQDVQVELIKASRAVDGRSVNGIAVILKYNNKNTSKWLTPKTEATIPEKPAVSPKEHTPLRKYEDFQPLKNSPLITGENRMQGAPIPHFAFQDEVAFLSKDQLKKLGESGNPFELERTIVPGVLKFQEAQGIPKDGVKISLSFGINKDSSAKVESLRVGMTEYSEGKCVPARLTSTFAKGIGLTYPGSKVPCSAIR